MTANLNDKAKTVMELLVRNASPADAARLASVSLSYVSQLMSDEVFSNEVAKRKALSIQEFTSREERVNRLFDGYLELEEKLLGQLTKTSMMMRPHEKMKLLQIVSQKKAPPTPPQIPHNEQNPSLVTIQIAQISESKFLMNSNKEIVAVGETTLAPMSPQQLKQLAAEHQPKQFSEHTNGKSAIEALFSLEAEDLGVTVNGIKH